MFEQEEKGYEGVVSVDCQMSPPESSAFFEALEGLSLSELLELDKGTNTGFDSGMCSPGRSGGCTDAGLIEHIKGTQLRSVINRSIIKSGSNEDALRVAEAIGASIAGNRHSGAPSFVAFVPHLQDRDGKGLPHVHVWHDCNPCQGFCKCALLSRWRNSTASDPNSPGFLCTRKTIPRYRPLRSVSTEEARKEGNSYFQRLFGYKKFSIYSFQI